MSTITKERIELFIKSPLDNGLTRGEQMELARIALASLEAEPVAWKITFTQIDREYNTFTGMYSDKAEVERWVRLHKACNFRADITPLYTAQPVPVIPDGWVMVPKELTPEMMRAVQISSELGGYATSNLSGAYNMFSEFWNVAVSAAPKVDDL
ncbi:TPA: hypothetical protein NY099_003801 [Escherichia coli]|nr:hypothetical protein BMR44_24890 [Escherichia coli]SQY23937.1 putative DnaJ-class molecular chaperone with C-terminal Zn finger domain [Escherichia coli]HCK0721408.1 hypothetical protein [Escherichia coli]